MKLLIQSTCVIGDGSIKERGETHETSDKAEIYALISSGRAIDIKTPEATRVVEEITEEKKNIAAARADKAKK